MFGIYPEVVWGNSAIIWFLAGGVKRRVGIAQLLIEPLDIILLDEPTNHLDVEGVAWLARHIRKRRDLAVVVITHDRWFLDEVSDQLWEVIDGKVESYDGGYSAYVLVKAERARQQAAEDARKNNLIRKELAWLRRGAPARTSKPKFRVDAANQLIASEPEPRNKAELLNFAANRLGTSVYEIHHAFRLRRSLVGSPSLYSGPGILPILARNDARLGLSPLFTGALRLEPGFSRS